MAGRRQAGIAEGGVTRRGETIAFVCAMVAVADACEPLKAMPADRRAVMAHGDATAPPSNQAAEPDAG